MGLTLGIGGLKRNACAALSNGRQVLGICEQERVTRVRGDGTRGTGLPDEAVDAVLGLAHATRDHIGACVLAEPGEPTGPWPSQHLDHHEAHACTAYLTSPWNQALILICDDEAPGVSVWKGDGRSIARVEWPWTGRSLSDLYTSCARLAGFGSDPTDQRFEALARTAATTPDEALPVLFTTDGHRIIERAGWQERVLSALGPSTAPMATRARVAAALSAQVAAMACELVARIHAAEGGESLCLGGSLFTHSSFNSAIRVSGSFSRVFVPANPGNAGLAVGAAMRWAELDPARVSAFMGPGYDPAWIKATLENCKLTYTWVDEEAAVGVALDHLVQGHLVGWFEKRMEWGPRALGARSILANPFAPFVLENLNGYLKRREPWRGYAVSVPVERVGHYFDGPADSPFMESDYRPRDVDRFRAVMPAPTSAIRVQTVDAECPPRFRRLLDLFGDAVGAPCLVNTSFNGFHEPIVCTPRDAVRVFFGSGLDVLILDQFVLTK